MTLPHFGLAVLVTVLWGFNVVVTKWGVDMMPPVFFAGMRFFVVAVLLAPFLKPVKGQMRRVVGIGLTALNITSPGDDGNLAFGGASAASAASASRKDKAGKHQSSY